MKVLAGILAGLVLSQVAVSVQTQPGSLTGSVSDGIGVLPGAVVQVSSNALAAPRTLYTNELGAFRLADVPPGDYQIELTLPGFQRARGNVAVRPGATSSATFLMMLGQVDEHVIVRSASLVAPTAAPSSASPRLPIRVGGSVRPPRKIQDVQPVYPAEAQAAGIQGDVRITAVIGRDGTVTSAQVIQGVPMLNAAAVDAVNQWRFTPAALNNTPTEVVANVTVTFTR